jgi:uncharacterized membrane protein
MLGALPHSESTPPLCYVLAWIWSQFLGTGEAGPRSLSAAIGTATVPATYAAARQLVSPRSAFVAAALVAVSPFLVWYSQEARAYALLVLLGALSLVPLRRAVGPRAGRPVAAWAVAGSLALATHYFALFLVAAEAVWLLRRASERRTAATAVAAVGVVAVALAVLAAYQARYAEHTAWISNSGGSAAEPRISSTSSSSVYTRRRTSDRSSSPCPSSCSSGSSPGRHARSGPARSLRSGSGSRRSALRPGLRS